MGGFPYWVLYIQYIRLSVRAKISSKSNFSKVDLFGWRCWEVDPMLEIDEFDPKRHPKSLVSVLSTCRTILNVKILKKHLFWWILDHSNFPNILLPPHISREERSSDDPFQVSNLKFHGGVNMRSTGVDQSHQNHEKTLSQAKAFFAENDWNSN